jgi:hypothetical protein
MCSGAVHKVCIALGKPRVQIYVTVCNSGGGSVMRDVTLKQY